MKSHQRSVYKVAHLIATKFQSPLWTENNVLCFQDPLIYMGNKSPRSFWKGVSLRLCLFCFLLHGEVLFSFQVVFRNKWVFGLIVFKISCCFVSGKWLLLRFAFWVTCFLFVWLKRYNGVQMIWCLW